MDKKILSAAIAGALAGSMAFAANADVTLYGQVDLSIDSVDIDASPALNGDDINMNSNQSAIGVKGSEDLGNGLKAIFMLEYEVDVSGGDTSTTGVTGRDQWIGLQGNFGKLRAGTASTTYKAHSASIDPFYRTSLQARNHGLQSRLHSQAGANGEGRMTNAIHYDTPDFNGFGASLNYSFDDSCTPTSAAPCTGDDDAYSLGAKYSNGPLYAFVSYVTSDKGGDDDATQIGGKYSFGDFAVYAQYEMDGGLIGGSTTAINQTVDGADLWHIGGSFTMGNAMVYAAYGQGDDSSAAANTEYDAWTIAGQYSFSKRTMVYAGFNQVSCDAGGWSNNATNQCNNVQASGGENDLFTLGMRHKF